MPLRLRNAPGTFRRTINVIMFTVKWQFELSCLDHFAVFSRTPAEHIRHVQLVLTLLNNVDTTVSLNKCRFFSGPFDYLGRVIHPRRLKIASHTTDTIRRLKVPTSSTKLRSFLVLSSVFRHFVPNFARLEAPLNKRLQKDQPVTFGTLNMEELASLNALKDALIVLPVQALPNPSELIALDTHTCDAEVGCVLLQIQPDDSVRIVGYWSCALSDADSQYNSTQKECLAIVWSIFILRPYLEENRFTIQTDHVGD